MALNKGLGDTTLEAARIQFSILRKMGLKERARLAFELSDGLRTTVETGVRHRHPDYNDTMVQLGALYLSIDKKLFRQAYPNIKVSG